MGRWLKTLRPYWLIILIIMGLLFIQAMCDLRLPDYTSKIIDTGIQAYGIEHTVPEKITQEELSVRQIPIVLSETVRICVKFPEIIMLEESAVMVGMPVYIIVKI